MKCKYKMRWFCSKGAFLVILWTVLIFTTSLSLFAMIGSTVHFLEHDPTTTENWLVTLPIIVAFVSAPLCGWLADAKFGNYKVFRAGTVLLFISTVINCLLQILTALIPESGHMSMSLNVCLTGSIFFAGACACIVTALPLGLDQMPDASSSNIASYISWFVCSLFVGGFVADIWSLMKDQCIEESMKSNYILIWALFTTVCMSAVLISNFLFSPKWLIIEPKSPQSLKTIYQVLKFAVKHKAPLNRSAFTYWEDNIPSGLNLGKSKYGGPFGIEQVEDVKTLLRLLVMSLPFSVIFFFLSIYTIGISVSSLNNSGLVFCKKQELPFFMYSNSLYHVLGTLVIELLIYPLAGSRSLTILKRIGIALLGLNLLCLTWLIICIVHYFTHSSESLSAWIFHFPYLIIKGFLCQVVMTASLEFMCAQSPYNMRGLLQSFFVPFALLLAGIGKFFGLTLRHKLCIDESLWCDYMLPFSVKTVLCFLAFLLFCVVARWYKRRVRDEDYPVQSVVEETYDRILTAAVADSRK